MSKIALSGNASGTGTLTIAAPNTNTDRTLTLPDSAGTIATVESLPASYSDSDALDLFNATGSAPVYACRAWVNFNGTGTVAIRESGNVSSITDNGTGDYTINFTTAMPDANYAPTFMLGRDGANIDVYSAIDHTTLPTTSALSIRTAFLSQVGSSLYADIARINIAIFR